MGLTDDQQDALLRGALGSPKDALWRLDRYECLNSFKAFVRYFWPILEPTTPMTWGRVLDVLCDHLEAVEDGRIKKLLICIPPGTAKSMISSVMLPAWQWARDPSQRIIGASYSEELALRDARKCKDLVTSDEYQRMFPHVVLDAGNKSAGSYANTARGQRTATSVGGTLTGIRADLIIVDDPLSAGQANSKAKRDEALLWFTESLPSRVNSAESRTLLIMQRLAQDDPAGLVLDQYHSWNRLILPMEYEPEHPHPSNTVLNFQDWRTEPGELLFPERFSREYLYDDLYPQLRAVGGEYAIAGQYQQRPVPRGGGLFQMDGLKTIHKHQLPEDRVFCRGWDFAATKKTNSAFTVGVLLSMSPDGRIFIEDVARGQWSPHEVENELLRCAQSDPIGTIQDMPRDPGQAGVAQAARFGTVLAGHDFTFSPETGSKANRAIPLAAQVEAGNVFMVDAAWNQAFVSEVSLFPNGRLKDQVDASTRAFSNLLTRKPQRKKRKPAGPIILDFSDENDWS